MHPFHRACIRCRGRRGGGWVVTAVFVSWCFSCVFCVCSLHEKTERFFLLREVQGTIGKKKFYFYSMSCVAMWVCSLCEGI